MWAVTASTPPNQCFRRLLSVSAKSQPPGSDSDNSSIKGLGHTILSSIKTTNPKQRARNLEKQKRESGLETEAELINGSDVLWALQKAAALKKEKIRIRDKKKGGPSVHAEKPLMDDFNVRPLKINSDWGLKLSEFEKRLQEFSL